MKLNTVKMLQPEVADASLGAHYKLWDGLETTDKVFDYSLNGGQGTVTNAVYGDRGFVFDGSADNIKVTETTSVDINGLTEVSVSAWINVTSDGGNSIGRIVNKFTASGYIFNVHGEAGGEVGLAGRVKYDGATDSIALVSSGVVLGVWTHVCYVHNTNADEKGDIYINGVAQSLDTDDAGDGSITDDSAEDLYIGDIGAGTLTFDGTISDVRIWMNARTAVQVKDLYEQTRWRYSA